MSNDPFFKVNGPLGSPSSSSQADSQFEFHHGSESEFQSQASASPAPEEQQFTANILIASFIPPSSSGMPGIENLAKSHPYLFPVYNIPPECSIVVTTNAKGSYVWTFIPMARGPGPQSAATDEGNWPRDVSFLGETMLLTKERWDELKCDQNYDCYIPLPPGIPTVSRRASTSKNANGNATESMTADVDPRTAAMPPPPVPTSPPSPPQRRDIRSPTPFPKRRASESSDPVNSSPHKRQRTWVESESGSDTEIEELLSDSLKPNPFEATKSKLKRALERETRAHDNLKSASFRMNNMMDNLPNLSPGVNAGTGGAFPNPRKEREKVAMETDPVQTKRHWGYGSSPEAVDELLEEVEDDGDTQNFTSIPSSKRPKFSFEDGYDERQRAWAKRQRELYRNSRRYAKSPSASIGVGSNRTKKREEHFWQDVDFKQFQGRAFSVDIEESEDTPTPAAPKVKQEHEDTHEQTPRQQHHEPGTTDSPIYVSESDDDAEGETTGESEAEKKAKRARFDPYSFDPDYTNSSEQDREAQIRASRQKLAELNQHDDMKKETKRKLDEERIKLEEQMRENRRRQQQGWSEGEESQGQRRRSSGWWSRYQNPEFFTRAPWEDGYRQKWGQSQGFSYTSNNWNGNGRTYSNTNPSGNNSSRRNTSSSNNAHQRSSSYTYTSIPSSSSTAWSSRNALERYNRLSASFDNFKPTAEKSVPTLDEIPWPVLLAPGFSIDQVDWTNVEKFFSTAESLMGAKLTTAGKTAWKEFLKASTRRFHPDRWRARGFIGDKGYGADVEDKVNHVAKVLTPLYRAVN